jgi:hypothetical protein
MNNREIGYALMRITYGVIFLFYGIGKFRGGLSNFVGGMNQQSGLLLIGLTFGVVMLGQAPTVAHNLQYVLVNFALLWFVDLNRLSIDSLFGRKASAGFTT